MERRVDKYAQHRADIIKNQGLTKQTTFIEDNIALYIKKLRPIFNDEFIERINDMRENFNIKNFATDDHVFNALYQPRLEYNVEILFNQLMEQIKSPAEIPHNHVKQQVKFYDKNLLPNDVENVVLNLGYNNKLLHTIWDTFQCYQTANILAINEAMPEENAVNMEMNEFLDDNSQYNKEIKKWKTEFNNTNIKLLKGIHKFKVRGRLIYFIIPPLLMIAALLLGLALLYK